MQALVSQKLEQLDKAIEKYNLENEKVNTMKREYEQLMRKVRQETKDLETLRKKMGEDVEKAKAEELDKIKRERKALEMRQKNL
jgi:molecular chaperone GrpE (heat shock protein)